MVERRSQGPSLAPPMSDTQWPTEIADMRSGFAGALNIYRVMAHHPRLLMAWQEFRNHVVLGNTLAPREQEIVILRTGYRCHSAYEWAHHVVRGRRAGLSQAEIEGARAETPQFPDARLTHLASAVDQLTATAKIDTPLQEILAAEFGVAAIMDLMATVGMYSTLAFFANSFDPPIDADVAAALGSDSGLV